MISTKSPLPIANSSLIAGDSEPAEQALSQRKSMLKQLEGEEAEEAEEGEKGVGEDVEEFPNAPLTGSLFRVLIEQQVNVGSAP